MIAFLKLYAREFILALIFGLILAVITTLALYRGAVRDSKELTAQNAELSASVAAEKAWSLKLSLELAQRAEKQKQSNGQKKVAEDKLDKSYAENPDWSGAPVPDSTANGLRDFLQTR